MRVCSDETGTTTENAELKYEPLSLQFAASKSDGRLRGGVAKPQTTVSINMGGNTVLLYNLHDPENPVELAFQVRAVCVCVLVLMWSFLRTTPPHARAYAHYLHTGTHQCLLCFVLLVTTGNALCGSTYVCDRENLLDLAKKYFTVPANLASAQFWRSFG